MRVLTGCLLLGLALAGQAQERNLIVGEQRLALVIGNSAYKVGPLRNFPRSLTLAETEDRYRFGNV